MSIRRKSKEQGRASVLPNNVFLEIISVVRGTHRINICKHLLYCLLFGFSSVLFQVVVSVPQLQWILLKGNIRDSLFISDKFLTVSLAWLQHYGNFTVFFWDNVREEKEAIEALGFFSYEDLPPLIFKFINY